MDIISKAPFYRSIQRYRNRRQYQLLGVTSKDKRAIRLGGKGKRRSWNVKVIRKMKLGFRIMSPIKILAKLRKAFNGLTGNQAGYIGRLNMESVMVEKRDVTKIHVVDEYESKLVFEIYRRLKDSRELASK